MTGNMVTPLAMLIIGHEIANMKVLDLIKTARRTSISPPAFAGNSYYRVRYLHVPACGSRGFEGSRFSLAMPCGTLNVILSAAVWN